MGLSIASLLIGIALALHILEERRVERLRERCRIKNRESEEKFKATGDYRHLLVRWEVR